MTSDMNTLSARDIRLILAHLDDVKKLTDLLRRAHFEVPYRTVYDAAGGEAMIRETLLRVAIGDVEVETGRIVCDVDDLVVAS